MKSQDIQTGIKRNQNGSIGEARTKSFLIDRFWILERSVDIDGADFIIQRRLFSQNILDDVPPRFGIIQSKYSQDENTRHYLKKEYVLDKGGNPNQEFFLIINVGDEDSQKLCLLSASDIADNFELNDRESYVISTKRAVLEFLVRKKSSALNLIEDSIQHAEFRKNRLFIFNNLSGITPDLDAISPEFKVNIEYGDGNIVDIFKEQRQDAYDFLQIIEEIHRLVTEFIVETNPMKANILGESFNHEYEGGLSIPRLFDRDFYSKTKSYLEQIKLLKKDNILDNFLVLKEQIQSQINSYLLSNIQFVNIGTRHIITVKYSAGDFTNLEVINDLEHNQVYTSNDYLIYSILKEGEIKMQINIGLNVRNNDLSGCFNGACLIDLVDKIYQLKYFKMQQ